MPPRLPAGAATSLGAVVQRMASMHLSTSARLAAARQVPSSSGASFLDLDKEYGRPQRNPAAPGSSSNSSPSPPPLFGPRAGSGSGPAAAAATSTNADANAALSRVLFDTETRRHLHERQEQQQRTTLEHMAERKTSDDYARQMPRRWQSGDLYSPHDLSPAEAKKWKRMSRVSADAIDILGIHPLDEYRNFAMVSEFMTPTGRIKSRRETGLRPVNQRRMARAIRRAVGLGLHPSVHRHPEILVTEITNLPRQNYASGNRRQR